jgi:hypothetical protein
VCPDSGRGGGGGGVLVCADEGPGGKGGQTGITLLPWPQDCTPVGSLRKTEQHSEKQSCT